MKKVFNASIIAAAMATAFAANAADVAVGSTVSITKEASAAGVVAAADANTVIFFNREELAAGDKVTLSFPLGTVLPALANIFVDKGAGVGSYENLAIVPATATVGPKITMNVATGSPVLANSKTIVEIDYSALNTPNTTGQLYVPAAGNVEYTAEDGFSGDPKDLTGNNGAALTSSVDQEGATVKTVLDGFIKRLNRDTFETSKGELAGYVTVTRNTAANVATVNAETLVVTASQDLSNLTSMTAAICSDGTSTDEAGACATGTPVTEVVLAAAFSCSTAGTGCAKDTVTFDTSALTAVIDGLTPVNGAKVGNISVFGTATASKDIPVTTFTVDRAVTYTAVAPVTTNPVYDYIKGAAFGEYQLDASVVNVPYLPVNYAHLDANVEVANAGSGDAEIQLEGFDSKGNKYGPVALADKAMANTVTKVSGADITAAFGLTAPTKLSITFVIDANAEDITLVPYYKENESRVNVLSDQYKGQ